MSDISREDVIQYLKEVQRDLSCDDNCDNGNGCNMKDKCKELNCFNKAISDMQKLDRIDLIVFADMLDFSVNPAKTIENMYEIEQILKE